MNGYFIFPEPDGGALVKLSTLHMAKRQFYREVGSHGQLVYALAHPRADGATHPLLDPLGLLEKLAVLVPWRRVNLILYHGVLARS